MAATMVIDPRPDGWEIINADDFSNAGSNGRVASFIEKIEGISPQKTLDDAARAIGASDWVTVDDLDDDILESRKSSSSPFDVGDDEYESYSSDKVFHTNTTHQSHVDGILDSINGAIASTRKSDERRSPKNMYTLYDEDMDVDSQSNDFYGSISYGDPNDIGDFVLMTAYGPDGADGHMECSVRSNNEVINTFDASSWEDAKEQFRVQSEVDGMYDDDVFQHVTYPVDLGVDYLNPYSPRDFANKKSVNQSEVKNMKNMDRNRIKGASMRKANENWSYWGEQDGFSDKEYFYGEPNNQANSVALYAEEQDLQNGLPTDGLYCEVITPDGMDVITSFTAPTWEDAKAQFDNIRIEYNDFNDYLPTQYEWASFNAVNQNKGANMNKKAYNQEFSIWGEDIIENTANQFSASLNYGEDGDENNSVTLYADGDNGPDGEMSAYVVENQYGDTINSFVAVSWEDAKDQFDSQCNLSGMYDEYLVTQEQQFSHLNGIGASRKRASVENSNGHVFDDSEWDAIVQNMDPDIREQLSEDLAPCSNQEFFDAYADAYYNKYGEEWELDKADPQW